MKKLFLLISLLFISIFAIAQQEINTVFANKMNLTFQPLEKNRVPFGLLKDQAFEFTELSAYNGVVTDSNYVSPVTIKQIYNTLLSARIHANASQFIQPNEYEQRWQANRSAGIITLSGLLYNYSQFKSDAVSSGRLQVITNQFKDKYVGTTWQNPYDTRLTFAIAPSVRTYKGYTFFIKMPSNLWLTNVTQTVQSIQIDANDGLGYRTTTFGQNLSVVYTTSGLKHWYYKITLSNGQILYSHSKIIIEKGLVTVPHIDSSVQINLSSTNTNVPVTQTSQLTDALGRKNITATLAYNGSFGSAKVVIDYASADHKIRRPLIVVEGFDQGILTNPEEEYGITSYTDFKFIVDNSNSQDLINLVRIEGAKLYDIIWVDFNNGTDYIQKNAYVLEEVIKWVNDEKLANGSIQSNIVFGASMGGLVARFALKDMEDSSIPTQTSLYISHDSPHQGANFPVGYQYMSRHALQQYVQSPLLLFGGEVIMPLFTDGVSPLDYLLIQNTPAARQMLINYIGVNYSVANTFHDAWQTELRFKGYPSMRRIAISNGNHCALTQNGAAGSQLLSIDGNYSTGWLTDILLTVNPMVNSTIFNSLAILTAEPGFLFGILPGGNKIKLDFKVNALPSSGTNQIYKGKITYTKKLLWLIDINVTITDKSFNSPSGMLPYDYYPGGAIETGVRNSASASGGSFWQQTFVKYKLNISTEPSFCFIPAASALDIGLGEVSLDNSDYLKKYNKTVPLVAPKISPFINFTTSYQNSFTLNYDDYFQSTNEHHIYLNLRNANWLAKEIDSTPNNNDTFDCTYMCPDLQIAGPDVFCDNAIYSVPNIAPNYNWTITQGSNLVTMTGNGTSTVTITALANVSGEVIISLILCDSGIGFANKCGSTIITKSIWIGSPQLNQFTFGSGSISPCIAPVDCLTSGLESDEIYASFNGMSTSEINTNSNWQWALENNLIMLNGVRDRRVICPLFVGSTGFKVRAKNACGWSEWVDYPTFEITECPNSYRLSSNTYIVSPNPSDDIVNIELRDANSLPEKGTIISGELFDMLGLSKSKVEILNNKATFSVRGLNKGIYVLKIYINDKVESYQIAVE